MVRSRIFHRVFSRPLVGLSCLVLLAALVAGLIVMQAKRANETRAWVDHTNTVLRQIDALAQKLYAAESAARGYVLTNAPVQLDAFTALTAPNGDINRQLDSLHQLISDNQQQLQNLQRARSTIQGKLDYMTSSLELIQSNGVSAAQDRIKNGRGILLMNEAIDAIRILAEAESNLLEARTAQDAKAEQMIMAIGIVSSILSLMVLGWAYIAIQGEFSRRLAVERALHASEQLKRNVIDNSFYPIISIGLDGIVQTFNKAAEIMLGYSAAEVIGIATPHLWHDEAEIARRRTDLSAETGLAIKGDHDVYVTKPSLDGAEEREWVFIRKDGTKLDVLLSVTPLRDGAGTITGFVGIGKDITERKQIEQLKNEFISTVSHELRTPLTSIRGSLGLVAGNIAGDLPDKAAQLIHIAYKNTERLVRLINNILDIEKLEAGRMVISRQLVNVDEILKQAAEISDGLVKGRQISVAIEPAAGDARVTGDPDRLLQVLTNFISNAVKFAPPQSLIHLSSRHIDGGIRLQVEDHGAGIPEAFKDKVFSRFAQADNIDPSQKSGSGLGLSISKAIVEEMGGAIGFESQPGRTVFYVDLPEAAATAPDQPVPATAKIKRVLICEDEPDIAALLKLNLEAEGYECTVALTAAAARAQLQSGSFMAMTLDLGLPDQDGMSFIKELREDPQTQSLPIVVISAAASTEGPFGAAVEVADWLPKPIDLNRLNRVMHNIVSASPLARVLHIEDDADIVEFLAASLDGTANFTRASSIRQAQILIEQGSYDLALLDIYLPDGNGLDLLPILSKQVPPIPVIVLSVSETSAEIKDKVLASLVKSVVSEEKIVSTVKAYIERRD